MEEKLGRLSVEVGGGGERLWERELHGGFEWEVSGGGVRQEKKEEEGRGRKWKKKELTG